VAGGGRPRYYLTLLAGGQILSEVLLGELNMLDHTTQILFVISHITLSLHTKQHHSSNLPNEMASLTTDEPSPTNAAPHDVCVLQEPTATHCGLCPTSEKLREFLNNGADMHIIIFRRGNMIYSEKNNYELGFQQLSPNHADAWSMDGCKFFSNSETQCKRLLRSLGASFTGHISICEIDALHIHERSDPYSHFNLPPTALEAQLKELKPFGFLKGGIHPEAFKGLAVRPRQSTCYTGFDNTDLAAFPQINVCLQGEWIEPLLCQGEIEANLDLSVAGKEFYANRVRLPEHVEILNDFSTGQVFDHSIDENFMVEFVNDVVRFKTVPSDYPDGKNYHHPFSFQVTAHEKSNCSVLMTQKGADGHVYKPDGYVYDDASGRFVEE
jgi:hypothetical protein